MKLNIITTSGCEFNWEVSEETAESVVNLFTTDLTDKVAFHALDESGKNLLRCVNFNNIICVSVDM